MKKILMAFLLMLTCQMALAQQALSVFNEYKTRKHADYLSVPHVLLSAAALKMKEGNAQALLQQVGSVKVLRLDGCRKGVRKKFAKKVIGLTSEGYEEYTRVKDDARNVLILVKQTDRFITEVVVLSSNDNTCSSLLVTGNINREDVEAVVDMVDE